VHNGGELNLSQCHY